MHRIIVSRTWVLLVLLLDLIISRWFNAAVDSTFEKSIDKFLRKRVRKWKGLENMLKNNLRSLEGKKRGTKQETFHENQNWDQLQGSLAGRISTNASKLPWSSWVHFKKASIIITAILQKMDCLLKQWIRQRFLQWGGSWAQWLTNLPTLNISFTYFSLHLYL